MLEKQYYSLYLTSVSRIFEQIISTTLLLLSNRNLSILGHNTGLASACKYHCHIEHNIFVWITIKMYMKYCCKLLTLLSVALEKYQTCLRWQHVTHYNNCNVYTSSTWLEKKNTLHMKADFMTSVYSYSELYVHFYSLWRQGLLCDIHIDICSKTVLLYYIQLELYTVLHSTSHFGLQQIEFWFCLIHRWWM